MAVIPGSRFARPGMTHAKLAPRKADKFLHDAFIDRPLERHDQLGKILHRLPAPIDELGLVAVAGIGDVDLRILAGEAHREPFLALAAIAAFPGASGDGAGDVVDEPVGDLAELYDRADAGFLVKLALGGFPGIFAGID